MNRPKEPMFLLPRSLLEEIVNYTMAVPTGNVPGGRLVAILNRLETLEIAHPPATRTLHETAETNGSTPAAEKTS